MAEDPGSNNSPERLNEEIARSREALTRNLRGLRYELDFPRKIRRSFRQQTVLWVAAAVAVGILVTVAPTRRKKIYIDPRRRKIEAPAARGRIRSWCAQNCGNLAPAGDCRSCPHQVDRDPTEIASAETLVNRFSGLRALCPA
jgi:hypothetical protein